MNSRVTLFVQAIRGPIVLILIGTLFLLQQLNIARLSQTWPFILIVIGLLVLLERMVAPPAYVPPSTYVPPPPPPGVYPR